MTTGRSPFSRRKSTAFGVCVSTFRASQKNYGLTGAAAHLLLPGPGESATFLMSGRFRRLVSELPCLGLEECKNIPFVNLVIALIVVQDRTSRVYWCEFAVQEGKSD